MPDPNETLQNTLKKAVEKNPELLKGGIINNEISEILLDNDPKLKKEVLKGENVAFSSKGYVPSDDDTISDLSIIKNVKEKKKSDAQKDFEKTVEEAEINFDEIEFEDEEKHFPKITDEELSVFTELTSVMMDPEIITMLYNTSREQITMYLQDKETPMELDFDTEEEKEEYVQNNEDMYNSSRKMLAYIQKTAKEVKTMFETDKIVEMQIRRASLASFKDYILQDLKSIEEPEEMKSKVEEFENSVQTSGLFNTSFNRQLNGIYDTGPVRHNMFMTSFIEDALDTKMYMIKSIYKNMSGTENIDINRVINTVEKDGLFYKQMTIVTDFINQGKCGYSFVEDTETMKENKKKFIEMYDKDSFIESIGNTNVEYCDHNSVQEKMSEYISIKRHNIEMMIINKPFQDMLYASVVRLLENDKYIQQYEKSKNIKIVELGDNEWVEFSKEFNDISALEKMDMTQWSRYYIAVEKLNLYRLVDTWKKGISESKNKKEMERLTYVILETFSSLFTHYIFNNCLYEYKTFLGKSLYISKEVSKYYVDFIMSMFNLDKTVIIDSHYEKPESVKTVLETQELYKRFKIEFSDNDENKEDVLFDKLDSLKMKELLIVNIMTIQKYIYNSIISVPSMTLIRLFDENKHDDLSLEDKEFLHTNGIIVREIPKTTHSKKKSRRQRRK